MARSAGSANGLRVLRRPPWVAAGAVVLLGSGLLSLGAGGNSDGVAYALVKQGDVTTEVGAAGTIQDADLRQLAFGTAGTVTGVNVKVGDKVSAGQVLARLDDTAAKEQVGVAQAALAAANAAYTQAVSGGGCSTSSAPPSASSAPSSTSSAPPQAGAGPAQAVSYADAPPATPTPSPTTPSPSPTEPSPSPTTPSRSSPTPHPTHTPRPHPSGHKTGRPQKGGKPKKGGNPKGGKTKTGTKGGSCASSGNPVENASAKVTETEVAVRQAERALGGTEITAPIAGTVLAVNGTVGNQVSGPSSQGFLTLGDLADLQVRAMFSLGDVNQLKIGQQATVTFGIQPGRQYTGTVAAIAPAASVTGNLALFPVMLSLDTRPSALLDGMSATVQVVTADSGQTLYVPETAIRITPSGAATVLVRNGHRTVLRTVKTGVHGDRYVAITSGLAAGDRVQASINAPTSG